MGKVGPCPYVLRRKKTVMHTESDYEKCVQVIMYVYEHMYDERWPRNINNFSVIY